MDKRRITEKTTDELKQESEWSQVKNTKTQLLPLQIIMKTYLRDL